MDCWAASLSSMEVILVLTGSALILRITEVVLADEEDEEEVGGSPEVVDAADSLVSDRGGRLAQLDEVMLGMLQVRG